mgnify:CR=1 FL=1
MGGCVPLVHLRCGQERQGGQQAQDELEHKHGQANAQHDLVQAETECMRDESMCMSGMGRGVGDGRMHSHICLQLNEVDVHDGREHSEQQAGTRRHNLLRLVTAAGYSHSDLLNQ